MAKSRAVGFIEASRLKVRIRRFSAVAPTLHNASDSIFVAVLPASTSQCGLFGTPRPGLGEAIDKTSLVEAHEKAAAARALLRRGIDPRRAGITLASRVKSDKAASEGPTGHTVEHLAQEFMTRHVKRQRRRPVGAHAPRDLLCVDFHSTVTQENRAGATPLHAVVRLTPSC
jgi:hypothetical protein